MCRFFWLLTLFISFSLKAQIITTFAGGGVSNADNIAATIASITTPHCVTFDKFGNFYFSDFMGCKVRKVDTNGIITTVAGTGIIGFGGDGGHATAASLKYPEGLVCDTFGNLFIADHQNFRIRKVDAISGIISTFAGIGLYGDSGDNSMATAAKFFPADICFNQFGELFISDNAAQKIRKINASGIITTFAGTGLPGFSGDGYAATLANLNYPCFLAIDEIGNLFIDDQENKKIRKIDTFGLISTIAGTGYDIYNGDGIPAVNANILPFGVLYYNHTLFITEDSNTHQRVRKIDLTSDSNRIYTIVGTGFTGFSGDGGSASTAQINGPAGITVDACGSIFFADVLNHRIRKVTFNDSCGSSYIKVHAPDIICVTAYSLFPNPAVGLLTITAPVAMGKIEIVNTMGQVVLSKECKKNEEELDVSRLVNGVYFVCINNEVWRKFVKE